MTAALAQAPDCCRGARDRNRPLDPDQLGQLADVSMLSKIHQLRFVRNACQHPKVRELQAKTRRALSNRGVVQDKKAALIKDPFQN